MFILTTFYKSTIQVILILLSLTFISGCAQDAIPTSANYRTASIILDSSHYLSLRYPNGSVNFIDSTTDPLFMGVKQENHRYSLRSEDNTEQGTLIITLRTLPNDSIMVFSRLESVKEELTLVQELNSLADRFILHNFDPQKFPVVEKNSLLGYDDTTNNFGLLELFRDNGYNSSILIGKEYNFNELSHSYSTGETSHINELLAERNNIQISFSNQEQVLVALNLRARENISERFFLFQKKPLTGEWFTAEDINEITSLYLKWARPLGEYSKLPWSIHPYTEKGYSHSRSFIVLRARDIKAMYRETGSFFFEDLLFNNLYTLFLLRDDQGLWRTPYTSTWLEKGTGIVAGFVDTRQNETVALHLYEMYLLLEENQMEQRREIKDWWVPFGDYLWDKDAQKQYYPTERGYFLHDYYNEHEGTHSHISLNHALGEMNYLLQLFEITEDPKYEEIALNIKRAVQDTGEEWINAAGDLHYQLNLDGTYKGSDYPTVTLDDLRFSQFLFLRLYGERCPVFDTLIDTKIKYLKAHNISIPSFLGED